MAEVKGALNLLDKALPTGVDGTRISQWMMRDGITYGALANEMAVALGAANQELVNKWGWLFYLTEEVALEYPDGGSVTALPEITDQDRPEPVHGTTLGHMIDLRAYGSAIGGTRRFWRDVRSAKIRSSVRTIVNQGIWRFEQKLLSRWFTNTENAVGTGYDVPFVAGTAGNVDFAPPAYNGEAFATSHNHYIGVDSGSKTLANALNELAETLQEHGHEPPYDALVARADISTYAGLTKFVEIVDIAGLMQIDRGGATTGNSLFRVGDRSMGHFGDYQSDYGLVRLRATSRLATGYAGLVKSYGQLDQRNPLAVRVHPQEGFGLFVVPQTTPNDDTPIQQLDVEFEFGVSVGEDRTNGAAAYLVSGGAWANPTIS